MTVEANEYRQKQREASNNARRYRQAVARIDQQVVALELESPSPRNKAEIRRLTRLSTTNQTRAQHWAQIESELS